MKINFRIITAYLPKGQLAYRLSGFFFIMFLILAGILIQILVLLSNKTISARKQFDSYSKTYVYWSSVASQYPTIPDVLYNAALSSLNDNRKSEAISYINKALVLDPLFKKAMELKVEIENRG